MVDWKFLVAAAIVAVLAFAFFIYVLPADLKTPFAIFFSTVFATTGWMVQVFHTRVLERDRYTLRLIEEFRSDREYMQHKNNIRQYYPGIQKIEDIGELARQYVMAITPDNYASLNGKERPISSLPVLVSIGEILNYYEELCYGIRHKGNTDEDTIWNTLSGAMIKDYQKFTVYLKYQWRRDKENFEHYRWVVNKWIWERKRKLRDGEVIFEPIEPEQWSNEHWNDDGVALQWGKDEGPWGSADVDQFLREAGLEKRVTIPDSTA